MNGKKLVTGMIPTATCVKEGHASFIVKDADTILGTGTIAGNAWADAYRTISKPATKVDAATKSAPVVHLALGLGAVACTKARRTNATKSRQAVTCPACLASRWMRH